MNRQLSTAELQAITSPTILPMTRREKLLRFATIIRNSKTAILGQGRSFVIFHQLEYLPTEAYDKLSHSDSPFTAAYKDKALREAGLASGTVGAAMRFFELSRDDLHAFSCDCGGQITNAVMANRIEKIASR